MQCGVESRGLVDAGARFGQADEELHPRRRVVRCVFVVEFEGLFEVGRRVLERQVRGCIVARGRRVLEGFGTRPECRRLPEVLRQHRRGGRCAGLLFHGRADTGVELRLLRRSQLSVQRLTDEGMREAVRPSATDWLVDESGVLGLIERVEDVADRPLARPCEQRRAELGPDDGCQLQDVVHRSGEATHAARHDIAHSLGEAERAEVHLPCIVRSGDERDVGLDQAAQELGQEERIAARFAVQRPDERGSDLVAGQVREQCPGVRLRDPLQRHLVREGFASEVGQVIGDHLTLGELDVAVAHDDEQRRVRRRADDMSQE